MSEIQIKEFAPVIIPTLCRFEHLKRLLESLEKCKYADRTDVYLGVDYPAKESHRPGYEKILEYLHSREFGFKNLHVFYRERNYGMGMQGNYMTLYNFVKERHNRYISTEDDNEFAPGFLEYINLNLEKYDSDPTVAFVCGYLPMGMDFTNSGFSQFLTDRKFAAWGYGGWFRKREVFDSDDIYTQLLSHPRIKEFIKTLIGKMLYMSLVGMKKGQPRLGDAVIVSYMRLNGIKSLYPSLSLVRNHGWDGSGTHGGYVEGYSSQIIDVRPDFPALIEAPEEFGNELFDRLSNEREQKYKFRDKALIIVPFYLYKYLGIYVDTSKLTRMAKKFLRKNV